MKYYSEKLNEIFNSIEDLEKAENEKNEKEIAFEKLKEDISKKWKECLELLHEILDLGLSADKMELTRKQEREIEELMVGKAIAAFSELGIF